MAWARFGDTSAMYPPLLSAVALDDPERIVNELFGFIGRCATQSAQWETDYLLDPGTVATVGGARAPELVRIAKQLGLITGEKEVNGVVHLVLVDDPTFIHIRTKAEVRADRQRKADNRNPTVTAAVRLRDGDQCRWCGVVTQWGGPDFRSARVGTYDHLNPVTKTTAPGTVETMVVACLACNSARKTGEHWDRPLLPPPAPPLFSMVTADFIAKHLGITVVVEDQRTGSQPVIAPPRGTASSGVSQHQRGPALSGVSQHTSPAHFAPGSDGQVSDPATRWGPRTGHAAPARGDPPRSGPPRARGDGREGDRSGSPGSGRDGTGQAGPGRDGAARVGSGGRPARGRRGRRRSS